MDIIMAVQLWHISGLDNLFNPASRPRIVT